MSNYIITNTNLFIKIDDVIKPSDDFLNDIFDKKIDIMSIYKICSFCNIPDFAKTKNETTFFYKNGFVTNK
jgi:hypothetical protein